MATVIVECWGGGASGGGITTFSTNVRGSGGGGGYSKLNAFTFSSGTGYTVTVGGQVSGTTAANGTAGNDSWFSTSGTVLAKGGFTNSSGTGGNGGAAISGIGDVTHGGGKGGNSTSGASQGSGGGGGGGGSTADGGNGGTTSTSSGGAAGTGGSVGGGNGATGAASNAAGGNGTAPGGGGSGAAGNGSNSSTLSGGAGAAGQVKITALLGTISSATGGVHSSDLTNDYWTFSATGTWTPTIASAGPIGKDIFNLNNSLGANINQAINRLGAY